jgi:DNA-binding XRE family transcriptional regulator
MGKLTKFCPHGSGKALKALRRICEVPQVQLAVAAGISVHKLSEIEKELEPLEWSTQSELLRCLGCTPRQLRQVEAVLTHR